MFVKFALFAMFAVAVFALPVDEKKPETEVDTVSRALRQLEEQGVIEDIRNLMGQYFGDESTAVSGEGRTKKKKKMETVALMILVLGATLVPLILGGLALIAGKALVVSKLALILALILGIKKLMTQQKEVIVEQTQPAAGWGRSIDAHAQNLAYSAYARQ